VKHGKLVTVSSSHRFPGVVRSMPYLVVSVILAWLTFWITLAGLFAGLLTSVVWIGVPILATTMRGWRGRATLDRVLARRLLRIDIPTPYRPLPDASWLKRWRARAGDPATWKDLLWTLAAAPILTTVWFLLLAVLWANGLIFSSAWIWYRWVDHGRLQPATFGNWALVIDSTASGLRWLPAGLALLVLGYLVTRGCARAHAVIAGGLLGPSRQAEVYARTVALVETRSRAVGAAEDERRRIERDLHDGTQQRLVALAISLGRAREKLADDPAGAEALLVQAHDESKRAITELRDLVRGIHPAVLTDRGLDAALSALAGRSPVPVEVATRLTGRVDADVETVAYFVVAEALTNIAKHAEATRAWVRLEQVGRHLVVEIRDDGRGGAVVSSGGGLAGLVDRAAGIDGTLEVQSPTGGPTVVRMELPCGAEPAERSQKGPCGAEPAERSQK
jgi:signal transduction histidine kinase